MSELEPALCHWRVEIDEQAFATLTLDHQRSDHNTLSEEVLEELDRALTQVELLRPRGLMVRSGKQRLFSVGADINEFQRLSDASVARAGIERVHWIFQRLDDINVPSVAVINGHCLGGALELALCCDYRVAVDRPDVRIGLPEIKLGIHPGYGGTARLIRTLGARPAMELMLTGRTLSPSRARRLGVIDRAAPECRLDRIAQRLLERVPPPRRANWRHAQAGRWPIRPLLGNRMRRKAAARVNPMHYPAPFALIDLWCRHGGDEARLLAEEVHSAARLVTSPTAQNLVRVFFLRSRLKSESGAVAAAPSEFGHIHVMGAGAMGGDIAAWCALQGLRVTLQDPDETALAGAVDRAHRLFAKSLRGRRRIRAATDRLAADAPGHGLARANVVLEAIVEDISAKQALLRGLEPRIGADALLATNTSSIPLETLADGMARPERLTGLHFFNPVARMRLVEVVAGRGTDEQWVQRATAFTRRIDRMPIRVRSSPGFLVNRILTPYLLEAVELVREGVPAAAVDQVAVAFGMPVGPIELADTVGLDICLSVARNLAEVLEGDIPMQLSAKVEAGQLGRKSGRGFYQWTDGRPLKPRLPRRYQPGKETCERLILRFLNEALACLRESLVADRDALDAAIVFATGFAPFRGGPLWYIRNEGQAALKDRLNDLATRHGSRFQPDPGWDEPFA